MRKMILRADSIKLRKTWLHCRPLRLMYQGLWIQKNWSKRLKNLSEKVEFLRPIKIQWLAMTHKENSLHLWFSPSVLNLMTEILMSKTSSIWCLKSFKKTSESLHYELFVSHLISIEEVSWWEENLTKQLKWLALNWLTKNWLRLK